MPDIAEFLTVAGIHLLAVMSPGPDFAVVTRNSLGHSRRIGVWSAAGVALGILVHVAYCLAGVGVLLSTSPLLFTVVRAAGAGYLIWVGLRGLLARPGASAPATPEGRPTVTAWGGLRMGFLTNALNPKATLFFLGLFTQVIRPATPVVVELVYAAEMVLVTFGWFALVALALSHAAVERRLGTVRHHVDRGMGAALAGFGIWMAASMAFQRLT